MHEPYRTLRFHLRYDDVPLVFDGKAGKGVAACLRHRVFWGEHVCGAYRLDSIRDCGGFMGRRCAEKVGYFTSETGIVCESPQAETVMKYVPAI
jgi:hypothetical protein